jgi:hypothetical protein
MTNLLIFLRDKEGSTGDTVPYPHRNACTNVVEDACSNKFSDEKQDRTGADRSTESHSSWPKIQPDLTRDFPQFDRGFATLSTFVIEYGPEYLLRAYEVALDLHDFIEVFVRHRGLIPQRVHAILLVNDVTHHPHQAFGRDGLGGLPSAHCSAGAVSG